MLAKYYTAEQIAQVLDVDIKRVWDWKRTKIIAPVLHVGEEQYPLADVVKLATLLALKDVFGEKHGAPAKLVAANSDELLAVAAKVDEYIGEPPLVINLSAANDIELRVKIADAVRERLGRVPA
jgi:hypothetical protein